MSQHIEVPVSLALITCINPTDCIVGLTLQQATQLVGASINSLLHQCITGVQDCIAEELDSLGLLAKPGCPAPRELTLDDLKKMPFLTACTKEAMRMLPVVSIMGR